MRVFNVRVTREQRALIERAAHLSGQTVSEFIAESCTEAARRILRQHSCGLSLEGLKIVRDRFFAQPQRESIGHRGEPGSILQRLRRV